MGFVGNLLSKVKGKKSDDYDDFDLDEDDDDFNEEGGVPAPSAVRDDDDFDDDDDYDDFGESSSKGGSKKKLIIIAVAGLLGLSAVGGGAYWYFFTGDEAEMVEGEGSAPAGTGGSVGGAVGMALQSAATGGLTPPAGGGVTGAKPKLGAQPKLTAQNAGAARNSKAMGGYDPSNTKTPLSTASVGDVGINIPAILPRAVAALGAAVAADPLPPVTDKSILEPSDAGLIPKVSEAGKAAWSTYARPFKGDPNKPLVGVVVTGLGMSATLTDAAINHLPADVTLSFSAYGRGLKDWVAKARAAGHEVMLELPMESASFPADDPGPLAMMTSKTPSENLQLLYLMMARAQGYTGFLGQFGSSFTKNKKALTPVLGEIKARGLFFMDPRTIKNSLVTELADEMQMPRAFADMTLQSQASYQKIRAQLDTLATIARNKKATAVLVAATPNTIKALKEWVGAQQQISVAPMTSLAGRQQF